PPAPVPEIRKKQPPRTPAPSGEDRSSLKSAPTGAAYRPVPKETGQTRQQQPAPVTSVAPAAPATPERTPARTPAVPAEAAAENTATVNEAVPGTASRAASGAASGSGSGSAGGDSTGDRKS